MVQLKYSVLLLVSDGGVCFNSCMVQLKFCLSISYFVRKTCFNSCMVQLKFVCRNDNTLRADLF